MDTVWWVLLFPVLGALGCALHSKELGRRGTGMLACLSILGAFAVAVYELTQYTTPRDTLAWTWLSLPLSGGPEGLQVVPFGAYVDGLTVVMLTMITGVAFLIHVYSVDYMAEEPDYGRFFSSLNLFVATMVCLVLADNLAMLLIGWGGVGYASYALIGFYSQKPAAVSAARKAFLINVVGDVGLIVAICLVATQAGSLRYVDILHMPGLGSMGGSAFAIGCCLLLAAYAKSAQVPLHTWLPDAMEGPTPVSALIHAATMVTAGVYLVVRCHAIFQLVPQLLELVAWLGALTAFMAACAAMVQTDLKRILAYSTMSQLGYMFLAAGVGACGPAIFHLVSHAFFKALLFLAAGAVIHALHGEQDIRKMGGLRKPLGVTHATFLVGALALAGLPPLVGFFSKEAILTSALASSVTHAQVLWGVALLTAFMTAYYTARAYFLVFHGQPRHSLGQLHRPGGFMELPLIVLAMLTVVAGAMGLGPVVYHEVAWAVESEALIGPELAAVAAALMGLGLAYGIHRGGADRTWSPSLAQLLRGCFGMDSTYGALFVVPMRRFCDYTVNRVDRVFSRAVPDFLGNTGLQSSRTMGLMQSGNLRVYALAITAGVAIFILFTFICLHQGARGGAV